jgi:diadenylate cyclase
MFGNPAQLIRSYDLFQVIIELAVIWVCVYALFRYLRGTRAAGIIKGIAILFIVITLVIRVLGQGSDTFGRLNFIYDRFLGLLAIVLIVIFQPELRQAMIRLSQARYFRTSRSQMNRTIEAVSEAAQFLSKNQFGAVMAIERSVKLGGVVEGGQAVDAQISARLLESIFWPNSPLHDLGVVIRGDRILGAGVQFPLAEEGVLPARTGSRHRAAVGLSFESDAVVVIVSEETGAINIAEGGRLEYDIPRDEIERVLTERLHAEPKAAPRAETEPAEIDESAPEKPEFVPKVKTQDAAG